MILELPTTTEYQLESKVSLDSMVQVLYANGFSGGKYGGIGVYANTPWFDETEKLQSLFPESRVSRLPNENITVIKPLQ